MVKISAAITARVLHTHRGMTPYITRIHTGFMVERSIQAVEDDIKQMQEMLQELRIALAAPLKTDSYPSIQMK